jgi:hypothetical protein
MSQLSIREILREFLGLIEGISAGIIQGERQAFYQYASYTKFSELHPRSSYRL